LTASGQKYLIVNADDFGQSPGINRGIIHAHEQGIVTSASLMVRWPAVEEAAVYARRTSGFSLGIHLDLGEWVCRDWNWTLAYQVVPLDDAEAIREEISRQLALFRKLLDRNPSHIDSHQHVHLREPLGPIVMDLAETLGVPLRGCSPMVTYCGRFYGQTAEGLPYPEGITVDALTNIIAELPPGITELGCHPGDARDLDTTYRNERAEELRVLCDSRIRSALTEANVLLCSFFDMKETRMPVRGT
jgi:predicted glycoside hydrolase/deacetylase ChbG (UPF0249 family)